MTSIISGNFQQRNQALKVLSDLAAAGFTPGQISTFFINSAGQRDVAPVENDDDEAPVSTTSDSAVGQGGIAGAAVGGAVGAAVGLAALPVLGPAAAFAAVGVGAYTGSLFGGLGSTEAVDHPEPNFSAEQPIPPTLPRKSGTLVAVAAPTTTQEKDAIRILRTLGAADIERTDGTIVAGDWTDFDSSAPVKPITN